MLVELQPENRAQLRPLFAGFPGLHGCLHAALEGTMGRAWADDAARPSVGVLQLDFYLLGGDPDAPAAEEAAGGAAADASIVAASSSWSPILREVWGDALKSRTRVDFAEPDIWDNVRLRRFIDALPPDFVLKRIARQDAARFTALADSLTYNFDSLEGFIERGVGFGIEHNGRFVSGCSSFAISSHSLEFEIQTHPDFRQRDLASATAAAMILHCVDTGLEPCWDAHNEISAALATKLGFANPRPYVSYELRP